MDDNRGVGNEKPFDAGGGWRRTRVPTVGVPTWHEAVHLCTLQVGRGTLDCRVVRTGTEATLSVLGTVAGTVVGEDFPTFVTEAGVRGKGASIWVGSSQGVKGVFVGEDAPE